jgi:hypothetical protein
MKFKEQIAAVLLAAMISLEAWQLLEISNLRADVARLDQKLTDHISTNPHDLLTEHSR